MQKLIINKMITVDNFDLIKSLLKFETEGVFYFLQILQRKKENPNIGSNSNVISTYYIKSINHLMRVKEEIILLCELYNARAYINLNPRKNDDLCLPMIKKLIASVENKDFSQIHRVFDSVCGEYKKTVDKTWIIDLDDYPGYQFLNEFDYIKYLKNLQPIGNKVKAVIPTLNGSHLITSPFNTEEFMRDYPNFDIHKNNPTILYFKTK